MNLTAEERLVIAGLRMAGYAVVIFSPAELVGVEPKTLENRLVELGNEAIEDLRETSATYKVTRVYLRGSLKQLLKTGLTLAEAQAHCNDPETSSHTATSAEAVERTSIYGPWFDGYDKENT